MDTLSTQQRSVRMGLIKAKNTKPEMLVRRLIYSMGFRYRLHLSALPGKPDLVFQKMRKVIFVHGCFWHRHDCRLGRIPKSRLDFWSPKLEKNAERDRATRAALMALGWDQLVIWECELKDTGVLRGRLAEFLGEI